MSWYFDRDDYLDDYRDYLVDPSPVHPIDLPLEGWEFPAGRDRTLDGTMVAFLSGAGNGSEWQRKCHDIIAPLLDEDPSYAYYRLYKPFLCAPNQNKPHNIVRFDLARFDPLEPYKPGDNSGTRKLWLLGVTCWGGRRQIRFAYWYETTILISGGEIGGLDCRSDAIRRGLIDNALEKLLPYDDRALPVPSTPFSGDEVRRRRERRKAAIERRLKYPWLKI